MKSTPRIINEFDGGPSHIYLGRIPHVDNEQSRDLVFYINQNNGDLKELLKELKVTPTKESISRMKQNLYIECEGIDDCSADCDPNTCPRPIEEVGEKGSGMEITEVIEGWFIDLGKCEPWIVCNCCNGKGYLVQGGQA